jgi:hypothetical protein
MTSKFQKPQWVSPTANNPLVQRLNFIRDKQTYFAHVEKRPDKKYDYSNTNAKDRIAAYETEFYMPSDLSWEVYQAMCEMLELGYHFKNIAYPSYYAMMNVVALSDNDKLEGVIDVKNDLETGGSTIAPSGAGKTKAIKIATSMIPSAIIHPPQDSAFQKPFLQVPVITTKLTDRSTLSVLKELLRSIDQNAGTTFYADLPRNNTEDGLLAKLRNACWQHGVGLVVLDEAQTFITESGKRKGSDSKNAKFLQRIFNFLCLPILLIGTPETEEFLSCNSQTLRRYKKDAAIVHNNYTLDSEYWRNLVEAILQGFVFCKNIAVSDAHQRLIYAYTAGNQSALQIYCKALIRRVVEPQCNALSEKLLKDVFEITKATLLPLTSLLGKPVSNTEAAMTAGFQSPAPKAKSTHKAVKAKRDNIEPNVASKLSRERGQAAHKLFMRG